MGRLGISVLVCAVAAALAAACASASSVFVVEGRGWGHGIGMSQWGAYGYARHGWSYPRILAHYYRGTRLAEAPPTRVRVLLARGRARVEIGCAGRIHVADATGRGHLLPAGTYPLDRRLRLPVGRRRVKAHVAPRVHHHARVVRARTVVAQRRLRGPLVLDCPAAPLVVDGRAYHGRIVVRRAARLTVVDSLSLEDYLRGVVAGEMPHRWSMAALEAQSVAARSYALATLKPGSAFDLFADTRSQVYGGIAYETPRTDLAVARTAGRILTWDGRPATTFFFSTSGGRTASIRDVWPRAQDLPYLRSVPDPYDGSSPHHRWGPVVVTAGELAARLHAPALRAAETMHVVRNGSGRAASVAVDGPSGSRRVAAGRFQARLGLRSTWFSVGSLTLRLGRSRLGESRLVYGNAALLRGRTAGLGAADLQAQEAGGRWRRVRSVGPGAFAATVRPRATTRYRLATHGVATAPVRVAVAPRLRVTASAAWRLVGVVRPRTRSPIEVTRRVAGGWRVVAHPLLDRRGRFSLPLRFRPGGYRVTVAAGERLAAATTSVRLRTVASAGGTAAP